MGGRGGWKPLTPDKFEEAVDPVREEGRSVTARFCDDRLSDGKASVFCLLLLLDAEASLREASKERIEARFLIMPRLQPT